ncbi:MAG: 2-oxoglutarate dehydrogenase complex dihydrolipoyllysine-residue succinyltransferase [Acidobacteriota bacterium]
MAVELVIPSMGESINEVEIGAWRKNPGDFVERDEAVVAIESDKATVELPAPLSGKITQILKPKGAKAAVGEVIGYMEEAVRPASASTAPTTSSPAQSSRASSEARVMPAAQRALAQAGLTVEQITASGPGGRVLKEDVDRHVAASVAPQASIAGTRSEEIVPMSMIRRRIAERLVHAKQTMAMLTTFNEIDMSAVLGLRKQHGEAFQRKYGIKLGMMSFFVRAAVDALREFPQLNAEIRGEDIIYRNFVDLGIAVGGGRGLVVPVIRNAERLGFPAIELTIADFGRRAKDNSLKLEELQGGTFTITNGGVYGSLLATPIINPPQVGILGMHAIQERPVARDGQVVIRPMMYVALSYDHRLVDGRESVGFLKRIKEVVEDPARAMLEI